jgi:hypothetical protein
MGITYTTRSGDYLNVKVCLHAVDVRQKNSAGSSVVSRALAFKLGEVLCNYRPGLHAELVPEMAHEGLLKESPAQFDTVFSKHSAE